MTEFRNIEIDFDVHQKIELALISFRETPNDGLRKLLGIQMSTPKTNEAPTLTAEGRPWSGKGVTLPHGTELRMEHNGMVYTGVIHQGVWQVEGQSAKSPSDAANSVAVTKDGTKPSLNGWIYWYVKRPGERNWKQIDTLRK